MVELACRPSCHGFEEAVSQDFQVALESLEGLVVALVEARVLTGPLAEGEGPRHPS